jgi:hypothetical protein
MSGAGPERAHERQAYRARTGHQLENVMPSKGASLQVCLPWKRLVAPRITRPWRGPQQRSIRSIIACRDQVICTTPTRSSTARNLGRTSGSRPPMARSDTPGGMSRVIALRLPPRPNICQARTPSSRTN